MHRIYLAGPMTGLTVPEALNWREKVKEALEDSGILVYSPLRKERTLIDPNKKMLAFYSNPKDPALTDKGILIRDFNDVRKSSAVLVNCLGATKVSIGTMMEVACAVENKIPVVVVIENEGNPHDHAMFRAAIDYKYDNLDAAVEMIKTIVLPD